MERSSGEGQKWSETTRCRDDGESAVDDDEDGGSRTTMEAARAGRRWGWQEQNNDGDSGCDNKRSDDERETQTQMNGLRDEGGT